jgi:hypothetical protein
MLQAETGKELESHLHRLDENGFVHDIREEESLEWCLLKPFPLLALDCS